MKTFELCIDSDVVEFIYNWQQAPRLLGIAGKGDGNQVGKPIQPIPWVLSTAAGLRQQRNVCFVQDTKLTFCGAKIDH